MSNFSYEPSIYDGKHTVVEQLEMTKAYLKGVEGMLKEGPTVEQLETKIDGSETVAVDVNEAGTALEVHLDAEVVEKIDRAILQPVDAVAFESVPMITPNKAVEFIPVSGLGGKIYRHDLVFSNQDNYYGDLAFTIYTSSATNLTGADITRVMNMLPTTGAVVANIFTGQYELGGVYSYVQLSDGSLSITGAGVASGQPVAVAGATLTLVGVGFTIKDTVSAI